MSYSCDPVDRWQPVLSTDGTVYCSPACGFRCTRASYNNAVAKANALAQRLGPGWEPIVSENGAWHYRVKKGVAVIHDDNFCFSAWLEFEGPGNGHIQIIEHAVDPEDALGIATQKARTLAANIGRDLAALYDGEAAR